ncbi:MAG: DUF2207 domain-containing protein [Thermodesulfovibrionales bacterium]|nr:DUF2207 domain-containing protein [Thermodesulfovibrionales bacterium]
MSSKTRQFVSILLLLSSLLIPIVSWADERILSYHSDIMVNTDGSIIVEETIQVSAEGIEIKRGIYRDFPLRYKDLYGNDYVVDFQLLKVLKDGKPVPHHTEDHPNSIRIYIGDKNIFLKKGIYTYTITYSTNRQIGFFGDHDELYWNVTGNYWAFPIDKASARVYLPEELRGKIRFIDAFTGQLGARGRDFKITYEDGHIPYFETTKKLNLKEGFTILISFPKGVVKAPTQQEKVQYFVNDNRSLIIAVGGLILVIIYYSLTWLRVGKDPEKGVIIPQFEPPKGYSPASMRFIYRMGFDDKALSSALINMAVKGFIKIKQDGSDITIIKNNTPKGDLSNDEKLIYDKIFNKSTSIELKRENNKTLIDVKKEFKNKLKNSYEKIYFYTNSGFFIVGAIFSLAVTFISAFFSANQPFAVFLCLWLTIWTMGVFSILYALILAWKSVFKGLNSIGNIFKAIFITLFCLPFVSAEIFAIWILLKATSPFFVFTLFSLGIINNIFYHLLKAPTLRGRLLMDKIEGFKQFLKTTEEDRLRMLYPGGKTPELFEKYLPFAIALDVESEWTEQFESVLKASTYESQREGSGFTWYQGPSYSTTSLSSIGSTLGTAIASSMSSASSSGSGSSGGGGGGGGGGGW